MFLHQTATPRFKFKKKKIQSKFVKLIFRNICKENLQYFHRSMTLNVTFSYSTFQSWTNFT